MASGVIESPARSLSSRQSPVAMHRTETTAATRRIEIPCKASPYRRWEIILDDRQHSGEECYAASRLALFVPVGGFERVVATEPPILMSTDD